MKTIPLSKGFVAEVDDDVFDELMNYKWWVQKTKHRRYAVTDVSRLSSRTFVYMHRVIARATHDLVVDHVDGDGLNNQRRNLRCCATHDNLANSAKRSDNTSGYKGVYWSKQNKKWMVMHMYKRQRLYLGCFNDPKEAAIAYDRSLEQRCGRFAKTNKMLGLL